MRCSASVWWRRGRRKVGIRAAYLAPRLYGCSEPVSLRWLGGLLGSRHSMQS